MGGLCFMANGKMCVGVEKDRLMARIDPDIYEKALGRKGCVPMDFTGRPMRGFVFVNAAGLASDRDLAAWLELALEFNPRAVSSKKKKKTSAVPEAEKFDRFLSVSEGISGLISNRDLGFSHDSTPTLVSTFSSGVSAVP